jgi:hypothetical protein
MVLNPAVVMNLAAAINPLAKYYQEKDLQF